MPRKPKKILMSGWAQMVFVVQPDHPHYNDEDWLFDDEPVIVEARVCSTRLAVAFDFRIEGWDYGCETVFVEPDGWRARDPIPAPNRPRRAF